MVVLTSKVEVRFWGWSENKHEEEKDFAELSQLAREGKPLYGESHQPLWVQNAAFSNSAFSQLKFSEYLKPNYYVLISLTTLSFERCFPDVSSPLCGVRDLLINSPPTRFNFVNHPHHGTDPAKYGVKPTSEISEQ